tara:strand:- start:2809 stop:3036 length:228 start_codon:yes stop_codon:yes gene_type:complete
MKNEKYNGWANYETWRVNLEIFDGVEDFNMAEFEMREFVEELIENDTKEGLARDYALAFISNVDWQEIAESKQEN